jgi:plasmid stability protein
MHRSQIILEDWQYQSLRARAEQEGRSISELVRDILRSALGQPPGRDKRLDAIEGIGEDPAAHGRAHDNFLYGLKDVG